MAWSLKWGPHVKAFELQRKKTGVTPRPLLNVPVLQKQDVPYFHAFQTVSGSRLFSDMGSPHSIQISEIFAFCQMVGIANRAERVKYLGVIQELDQIWLKHSADTQKNKKPQTP